MVKLNPSNVPASVRPLIPWAEEWGIGDDYERAAAVQGASDDQLKALIAAVEQTSRADFYGWLAGPESYEPRPSVEYVAMSDLAAAEEYARVALQKRGVIPED